MKTDWCLLGLLVVLMTVVRLQALLFSGPHGDDDDDDGVVREWGMIYRGCHPNHPLDEPKTYAYGDYKDMEFVCRTIRSRFPHAPMVLLTFHPLLLSVCCWAIGFPTPSCSHDVLVIFILFFVVQCGAESSCCGFRCG